MLLLYKNVPTCKSKVLNLILQSNLKSTKNEIIRINKIGWTYHKE